MAGVASYRDMHTRTPTHTHTCLSTYKRTQIMFYVMFRNVLLMLKVRNIKYYETALRVQHVRLYVKICTASLACTASPAIGYKHQVHCSRNKRTHHTRTDTRETALSPGWSQDVACSVWLSCVIEIEIHSSFNPFIKLGISLF